MPDARGGVRVRRVVDCAEEDEVEVFVALNAAAVCKPTSGAVVPPDKAEASQRTFEDDNAKNGVKRIYIYN